MSTSEGILLFSSSSKFSLVEKKFQLWKSSLPLIVLMRNSGLYRHRRKAKSNLRNRSATSGSEIWSDLIRQSHLHSRFGISPTRRLDSVLVHGLSSCVKIT